MPAVAEEDHDPFGVLRNANTVLLHNLRRDELSPELQKQLTATGMASTSQAYFCDPYTNSYLGPQIRSKSFAMLPEALSRERDRVECMTFMGLLPEIDHAWMTVDNVLYLWNYHTQDFTQFRELEQVIVTVALVPPKKGVFNKEVEHVLAVATTVEVILLAVTYHEKPQETGSPRNRRIQVRRTNFRASTDGVSMLKIAAHPNGRVFMAGKDGNLYELTYSVAYGFWYSVFSVGSPVPSRQCSRLAHKSSSGGPSPVNSMFALLGLRRAERVLVDVVVDPLRNVLYTLDLAGDVDLFDLGADGNSTTQKAWFNNVFNIWTRAARFCQGYGNGQSGLSHLTFKDPKQHQIVSMGVVPATESKTVALVAVTDSGMRIYLSCGSSGGKRHNFRLTIVQIRCPPPEKLWQYLHQHQGAAGAAPVPADGGGGTATAQQQQQQQQQQVRTMFQPADGFPAKWERKPPSVYGAYCCGGVTVLAQALTQGDRLVLIGSDLITRAKRKREMYQEEHPSMREAVAEMGDSAPAAVPTAGGGAGGRQQQAMGRVWAISERPVTLADNPEIGRVRALLALSGAPSPSDNNGTTAANGGGGGASRSSSGAGGAGGSRAVVRGGRSVSGAVVGGVVSRAKAWQRSSRYASRPVAPSPPLVASPGGSAGFPGGLNARDVGGVVQLPELGVQPYSNRRELLCLTGAGLQVLTRLRPVDLLYDLLARNHVEGVRLFFDDFSPDQSAAMCFSIACGLPLDLGTGSGGGGGGGGPVAGSTGGGGYNSSVPTAYGVPSHTVRARALDAALMICKPPGFSSPGQPAGGGIGIGIGGGVAATAGGVIMGEKFTNSALHNGLQLFIARLLRPFWFLPVVVAPPGGGGGGAKRSADGTVKSGGSPPPPPFVRDLEALRVPLESLRSSIRAVFPRAVGEDLAALASREAKAAAAADARRGAELLAEAAREWRGERALGADGQLARACAALTAAGRLEAVVDVCMTCAKNFGQGVVASGGGGQGGGGGVEAWEEGVYQGGGIVGAEQREKARLECYKRVLEAVVGLLKKEQQQLRSAAAATGQGGVCGSKKVDSLIARCLSYKAPLLEEMLFGVLEEHDKKLLMSIRTPGVEQYLKRDPEDLFRHYMLSKEYPKAVHLMDREARVEARSGMHVRHRVECLLKAISACHKCDLDSAQMVAPGWSLNHAKLRTMEDERDVLLVQERLLSDLKATMAPLERLAQEGRGTEGLIAELAERRRIAETWTTDIVEPSELYRQASGSFLWEGCLRLMQCCEFDEPIVAKRLIRSIIWREVPSVSRGGSKCRAQVFISSMRDRPGEVEVDDVRQELDR
ncbi:unnamed protein product, partial [Ectocarpus sp. 12 AP-2014]